MPEAFVIALAKIVGLVSTGCPAFLAAIFVRSRIRLAALVGGAVACCLAYLSAARLDRFDRLTVILLVANFASGAMFGLLAHSTWNHRLNSIRASVRSLPYIQAGAAVTFLATGALMFYNLRLTAPSLLALAVGVFGFFIIAAFIVAPKRRNTGFNDRFLEELKFRPTWWDLAGLTFGIGSVFSIMYGPSETIAPSLLILIGVAFLLVAR